VWRAERSGPSPPPIPGDQAERHCDQRDQDEEGRRPGGEDLQHLFPGMGRRDEACLHELAQSAGQEFDHPDQEDQSGDGKEAG